MTGWPDSSARNRARAASGARSISTEEILTLRIAAKDRRDVRRSLAFRVPVRLRQVGDHRRRVAFVGGPDHFVQRLANGVASLPVAGEAESQDGRETSPKTGHARPFSRGGA